MIEVSSAFPVANSAKISDCYLQEKKKINQMFVVIYTSLVPFCVFFEVFFGEGCGST